MRSLKNSIKDGISRTENLTSQGHVHQKVFNNDKVLTRGWYPVCESHKLKAGQARSYKILNQRVVVYRSEAGNVHALDAFCPHLGADLGNGKVVKENIRCYFHQWEFSSKGLLANIPCLESDELKPEVATRSYPITELYGHIWIHSTHEKQHEMLRPSGLEGEKLEALYLKEVTLFAHHHVMMANGVDLQHFSTVHALDIKFDYEVAENDNGTFIWKLKGKIPTTTFKGRVAKFFLGEEFEYHVKFAGGSAVCITYGVNTKIGGLKFPGVSILWGCLPQRTGISKVRIFFVVKKRPGFIGRVKNLVLHFMTFFLLMMLRDEDIKAFPNMRFNAHRLIGADKSLGRFIQMINKMEKSDWGEM